MASVNLSTLPEPSVVAPLSYEEQLDDLKNRVIAALPELEETLQLESEPLVALLEALAYRLILKRDQTNLAAKSVMPAYATGSTLDHIVSRNLITRLEGESDQRLLARYLLSTGANNTAGSASAYRYHAMSAHSAIENVGVACPKFLPVGDDPLTLTVIDSAALTDPQPGNVAISLLIYPDEPAEAAQAALDAVQAVFDNDDLIPETDLPVVRLAHQQDFNLTINLVIRPEVTPDDTLAAAQAVIDEINLEYRQVGAILYRSELTSRLQAITGVNAVEVAEDGHIAPSADAHLYINATLSADYD